MEIIKSYSNLTIYGSATLILSGWSNENHMYYQWFLHFESSDPEKQATDSKQTVKYEWEELQKFLTKPKDEEELLLTFMNDGLRMANGKLFQFIQERVEQKNAHLPIDNELNETSGYISAVMFLKRKSPEFFDWMADQVLQEKLKESIQIAKGISYSEINR